MVLFIWQCEHRKEVKKHDVHYTLKPCSTFIICWTDVLLSFMIHNWIHLVDNDITLLNHTALEVTWIGSNKHWLHCFNALNKPYIWFLLLNPKWKKIFCYVTQRKPIGNRWPAILELEWHICLTTESEWDMWDFVILFTSLCLCYKITSYIFSWTCSKRMPKMGFVSLSYSLNC